MPIPGNLLTTAMAVMPHTDSSQALEAAMSLDIPFWPQLPRLSYYEDMYVQASEHFPGIVLDSDFLIPQNCSCRRHAIGRDINLLSLLLQFFVILFYLSVDAPIHGKKEYRVSQVTRKSLHDICYF